MRIFAACCLVVLFGTAVVRGGDAAPVKITPWPMAEMEVSGASGDGAAPKDLPLAFDGKKNTHSVFAVLAGSTITVRFARPRDIPRLALSQGVYGNWSRVRELAVSADGGPEKVFLLADKADAQVLPLEARDVGTLTLTVKSAHAGSGRGRWGGFAEIGESEDPNGTRPLRETARMPAVRESDGEGVSAAAATVRGSENRILKITPWPAAEMAAHARAGDGTAPKDLAHAFDGRAGAHSVFSPLAGSAITVRFDVPRDIPMLALSQGTWANWSRVRELAVSVDGGPERLFLLADDAASQGLPLEARGATSLALTVKSVYAGPGRERWGGFTDIGDGGFDPFRHMAAARPFHKHAEALEFSFDVRRESAASVVALVTRNRLPHRAPDLALKPGTKAYRVDIKDFKEEGPWGLDWSACHIHSLELGADPIDADPGFDFLGVREIVPPDAPEHSWYEMPAYEPPTLVIDGEIWTEGMSYSSSGRFGNSTYNGLLNEVAGDFWFQTFTAGAQDHLRRQRFDLYVRGRNAAGAEVDAAQPWLINNMDAVTGEEIEISWTHMRRTLPLAGGERLAYLFGALAPGFLWDAGLSVTVASRGGGDIPRRSGAPDEDEHRFFVDARRAEGSPRIGPTLVVTPDAVLGGAGTVDPKALSAPWIVAVWGGLERPTFWGDGATAVLFTWDGAAARWGAEGVTLPAGRVGVSSSFHGCFGPDWDVEAVRARAGLLAGLLRNYAYDCREFYRVDEDGVRIRNSFTYEKWGDPKHQAPDYAPLPPMLTWAALDRGWGELPLDPSRTVPTSTGPWTWNPGAEVAYRLPHPANEHAAFPRTPAWADLADELSDKFLALPEPAPARRHFIGDAWQTAYRPLEAGKAILASAWLGKDARERLHGAMRENVVNSLRDYAWIPRRERFGGRAYLASLWVDGKVTPAMFGDINSGVGAAGYTLYAYSLYSGDWETARVLYPRLRDVMRFAEVVNDWTIPMTSAREGILFGGIDMDTVGFLGVSAAARLAARVGSSEDHDRFRYLLAKIAPATALRFTFPRYLDPKGRHPALFVNGFSESGPNTEWATPQAFIAMDHVAMMFSWEGQQPEMYRFLNELPGSAYMELFQREMMDKQFTGPDFSGWRRMPFNKERTSSHLAMRAWLPNWDRAALANDYRIWLENAPEQKALNNAGFFGAYFGGEYRIWLTDWAPAALGQLRYDPDARELTAELRSDQPFTLSGKAPARIVALTVDGAEIPLPGELRYRENAFSIPLPPCRETVALRFAP